MNEKQKLFTRHSIGTRIAALFMLFGVFGGVFNTYSSLYKAKDNDLMLSLGEHSIADSPANIPPMTTIISSA